MFVQMLVRTYAQTDIWLIVRLIAQTSVRTYAQTSIWLIVWLIVQTSVRTDIQTNIWLIAQTNKQTKVRTHLQTFDWTFERSFVWTPECLGVVASSIWVSVQVERRLCLKRFLIVRYFPTFPQSCPTFPHFFLDENSTTIPDCYICGSRHTRFFSHWPPLQGLHTIIISVWIGTDIMNRPPLRTTFYDIQGGFRLQYSHYQFGCTNVHGKVCSEALVTKIVPLNPCHCMEPVFLQSRNTHDETCGWQSHITP